MQRNGESQKELCTNNANNIVAAGRLNGLKHLPCFAHTLNLVVQIALKPDTQLFKIQKKCHDIVSYFHRSTKAMDKLVSVQNRLKLNNHKLIPDVDTCWNSVFYMFERLIEQHEAVTTLCLVDKSNLCITTEEIEVMKSAVVLLRSFETATREILADQYPTISKLFPLVSSLQQMSASTSSNSNIKPGDELFL